MAKYNILKSFYGSEKWQNFRAMIIAERGPVCETCGKVIANPKECEIDHYPIELTPENVNDANISLNPENVKVRDHDCHNKRHNRFSRKSGRNIYIVYGPPLAGKHTFVHENIQRGDIVVDMDSLYSAVSLLPAFDKPDNLLNNVRGIHDLLLDNIKTRYGKWNDAWVIGGYADKYKREKLADELGAELVFCDVSKDECLNRLEMDIDRRYRKDEWRSFIKKWFEQYT
ncbi:HNH endonuclease [Desulfosporosinus sp. PR]|uniref:HNH endonuclease n=1 Tax=Candidatus Desulfosporosinus nitrosoreducens TaxID=3401928 RepID=UPI0027FCA7C3|nr:HNH endonuclease [Desulfosporosinus sp. PR]MDQ7095956.1 HNH endonuclease [Desulfosporosinus sp. PR]